MANVTISQISAELTDPNNGKEDVTYIETDHSTDGTKKMALKNIRKLITEKWVDPSGGYIMDGNNDVITVPHSSDIDFSTDQDFSFGKTFELDDWTPSSEMVLAQKYDSTNHKGWRLSLTTSGELKLSFGNGTDITTYVYTSFTTGLTSGKHFIGFAAERDTNKTGYVGNVEFYVDGQSIGTVDISGSSSQTLANSSDLLIASDGTNYYAETVYRPYLFNMLLSSAQFEQLWNNGSPETATIPYELQGANVVNSFITGSSSDFEGGVGSWTAQDSASVSQYTSDAYSGSASLKIDITTASLSYDTGDKAVLTKGGLEPRYYMISFYAKSLSGGTSLLVGHTGGTVKGETFSINTTDWTHIISIIDRTDMNSTAYFKLGLGDASGSFLIDDFKLYKAGNVLDLKPSGAGNNAWVGTLGGASVIANTSGSPIVIGKGELETYKDGQNGITGDTTLTDIAPAGYRIKSIYWKETAGGSATVNIGTTASGTDVVNGLSVTANGEGLATISKDFFSSSSDQTLYISSADWSGVPSIDLIFVFEKIGG